MWRCVCGQSVPAPGWGQHQEPLADQRSVVPAVRVHRRSDVQQWTVWDAAGCRGRPSPLTSVHQALDDDVYSQSWEQPPDPRAHWDSDLSELAVWGCSGFNTLCHRSSRPQPQDLEFMYKGCFFFVCLSLFNCAELCLFWRPRWLPVPQEVIKLVCEYKHTPTSKYADADARIRRHRELNLFKCAHLRTSVRWFLQEHQIKVSAGRYRRCVWWNHLCFGYGYLVITLGFWWGSGATKIRSGTEKKGWSCVKWSSWEDIFIIFSTWAEFFPAKLNEQDFISKLKLEEDNKIWCLWAAAEVIQLQYETAGIISG